MKNKGFILLISFVSLLSINCCLASASDTENQSEETTEDDNTEDLFNDIFVELSDQVGIMTFEECISYMEDTSFEFEIIEPSDEDMGTITVEDIDHEGFQLVMYSYPNDNGDEILTLLSYSNGDYEGSVTDNLHMDDITYGIYDISSETRNIDVDTLEDIISYINNDVPEKIAEYSSSVSENEGIEVSLEVSSDVADGIVYFTILTNLPDETIMSLTLTNDDGYTAQAKVTIIDGTATSDGFSKSGESLSGHFSLKISTPVAKSQPESVMAIIGTQGEFLTGPYVTESTIGSSNIVSGTFEFDF